MESHTKELNVDLSRTLFLTYVFKEMRAAETSKEGDTY